MSAEDDLYSLACSDMPVAGDEVREAMNAWAHELAEEIRAERDRKRTAEIEKFHGLDHESECVYRGMEAAADLIDPEMNE